MLLYVPLRYVLCVSYNGLRLECNQLEEFFYFPPPPTVCFRQGSLQMLLWECKSPTTFSFAQLVEL